MYIKAWYRVVIAKEKLVTYFICFIIILAFLNTALLPNRLAPIFPFIFFSILLSFIYIALVERFIRVDKYNLVLLFLLAWACLVTLVNYRTIDQLFYFLLLSANVLLVCFISNSSFDFKFVFFVFHLMCFSSLVLGLVEVFSGIHLPNSRHHVAEFFYVDKTVPTGSFYNENNYASVTALGGCYFFYSFLASRKILAKFYFFLLYVVSVYLVLEASSRINTVGIFLPMLVYVFFVLNKSFGGKFSAGLRLSLFSIALIVMLFAAFLVFSEDVDQFLFNLTDSRSADSARFELARIGLFLASDSFLLGVGSKGFELYCTEYLPSSVRDVCSPHNWLVEMLANFGLFGFVVFLFLYYSIARNLIVYVLANNLTYDELFSCLCLLSMLFIIVLAGVSVSSIISFPIVWIFFGIIISYDNNRGSVYAGRVF